MILNHHEKLDKNNAQTTDTASSPVEKKRENEPKVEPLDKTLEVLSNKLREYKEYYLHNFSFIHNIRELKHFKNDSYSRRLIEQLGVRLVTAFDVLSQIQTDMLKRNKTMSIDDFKDLNETVNTVGESILALMNAKNKEDAKSTSSSPGWCYLGC